MKIKIKVSKPISITTGDVYFKDEYIVFGDYLYRIDINKFLNSLDNEGIREFKNTINELTRNLEKTQDITRVNINNYANFFMKYIKQSKSLPDWIRYKAKIKIEGESQFKQTNIKEVIKDSITNKPIIPGSTIKGALRTLFIKEYLKINENFKSKIRIRIENSLDKINTSNRKSAEKILKDTVSDIENEVFCVIKGDERNKSYTDIMKLIQVTDFTMEKGSISVRKVMREKIRGKDQRKENTLPIYLEAVDEGSEFTGEIKIVNHKCELENKGLLELLGEFNEEFLKEYVKKISKVGFGKGFKEQTILFEIFDTNNEKDEKVLKIIMKKLGIGEKPGERNYKPNPKAFPKTKIVDSQSNGWAEVEVEVL